MRTCVICKAAENPLGRLRFKKHVDRKLYCENCLPAGLGPKEPGVSPQILSPTPPGVALLVVIPCPACRLISHKPHGKICVDCSGYGSVRIEANFLNVYRPTGV